MRKYIFSNGTIRVTKGIRKPQRGKNKFELATVVMVFADAVMNQERESEPTTKESDSDESRTEPEA